MEDKTPYNYESAKDEARSIAREQEIDQMIANAKNYVFHMDDTTRYGLLELEKSWKDKSAGLNVIQQRLYALGISPPEHVYEMARAYSNCASQLGMILCKHRSRITPEPEPEQGQGIHYSPPLQQMRTLAMDLAQLALKCHIPKCQCPQCYETREIVGKINAIK